MVFQRVECGPRAFQMEGSVWRRVACLASMEPGVCEGGVGGANVGKLCCGCSGEAVDELAGRREKGGPVSLIPLRGVTARRGRVLTQGPSQITQRRPR